MFTIGRNSALGVGAGLLLLVLPGTAFGHDLKIYKAEAQLTMEADQQVTTVSCEAGDHALDGMWRIDHADQDDYIAANELLRTAVDATQAAPTADGTYSFAFEKNAIGRVQIKLFVTCLGNSTDGGGHTHTFPASGGSAVFSTFGTTTVSNVTGTGSALAQPATSAACPSGQILVSPGFTISGWEDGAATATDPTPQAGRLYESNYTGTSLTTWRWGFDFSSLPSGYTADVTTTWRCLKIKVNQGAFDKHKLIFKHRSATPSIAASGVTQTQLNCGDAYKAVVAGFSIDSAANGGPSGANSDFQNVWYLGMDPRIKSRAYRFLNIHGTTAFPVTLRAACLNYRTS